MFRRVLLLAVVLHAVSARDCITPSGKLKDGAYAGGALGGLMMLALAIVLTMLVMKAGPGPNRWLGLVGVTLALMAFIQCVVGAAFITGSAVLVLRKDGFSAVNQADYGTYGLVSSAGLIGGAAFVAFFIAVYAAIECARQTRSQMKPLTVPMLVFGWALYLLGIAVQGFGSVHLLTLTGTPSSCSDDQDANRKASGAISGLLCLTAWLLACMGAVLKFAKTRGQNPAPAQKADDLSALVWALALAGVFFSMACSQFERVYSNPPKSARQAAYAIPGLWYLIVAGLLVVCVVQLKKSTVLGHSGPEEIALHKTAFYASLAITIFNICVVDFYIADHVTGASGSISSIRDMCGFLCFFQFVAAVIAAVPPVLRFVACFKLRATHHMLPILPNASNRPVAAVDSGYDRPWNLFMAWWVCTMFGLVVTYGHTSAYASLLLSPSLSTLDDIKTGENATGVISGFAYLAGMAFMCWASLSVAQGKGDAANSGMAGTDAQPQGDAYGQDAGYGQQAGVAAMAGGPQPQHVPRFDPMTGQPIAAGADPTPRFDPQTGKPLA